MKAIMVLAASAVALFCLAAPALAETGDMRVRVGILHNMPTDDLSEPGETLELDAATGFQLGFEYMVTDAIGVEPAFSLSGHDVEVSDAGVPDFDLGEIDYMALTANVNFHVLQRDRFAVHVGPTVGYVFWGDLETDVFAPGQKIDAEDDFAFGANVGVEVPFGDRAWAFSGGLTYLFTEIALDSSGGSSSQDLGVDPVSLRAGVSYRF